MKYKYYMSLLFVALYFSASAFAQMSVKIVFENLRNDKGQILIDFCDKNNKTIRVIAQKIENKSCTVELKNIAVGSYCFKYFHDENSNKKLDTNMLGIPKEGYGFSNNAKGKFGPPDLEQTIFEIKQNLTLKCITNYILN